MIRMTILMATMIVILRHADDDSLGDEDDHYGDDDRIENDCQ